MQDSKIAMEITSLQLSLSLALPARSKHFPTTTSCSLFTPQMIVSKRANDFWSFSRFSQAFMPNPVLFRGSVVYSHTPSQQDCALCKHSSSQFLLMNAFVSYRTASRHGLCSGEARRAQMVAFPLIAFGPFSRTHTIGGTEERSHQSQRGWVPLCAAAEVGRAARPVLLPEPTTRCVVPLAEPLLAVFTQQSATSGSFLKTIT